MTLLVSAPAWLAALLLLLLLAAAVEDVWRMEIADWTNGAVAAIGLMAVALDGPEVGFWQNLLLSAAALGFGWSLFRLDAWGGGDVKLLAASSLWFDLSSGWKMLTAVAVIGGIETLILLGLRRLPWSAALRRRVLPLQAGEGIPYGIAIALGVALMGWWLRR